MGAIENITRPFVEPGQHPIETTWYVIATPPIKELGEAAKRWVENRVGGAIITAMPRDGKSTALDYMERRLPDDFKVVLPIFVHLCHSADLRVPPFFTELLKSVKHGCPDGGTPGDKLDRLVHYLAEKARTSKQDRIIWFMDEAQNLRESHYKVLIDIYNRLRKKKVNLIVFLVGQPDLKSQRSVFILTKANQIVGRFMVHSLEFRGLRTVADIKECLKQYDEHSEYPLGSGWSFSQYFFPRAFMSGWRLHHCAEMVHQAFRALRGAANISGNLEIPMQYFCRTVEHILKTKSKKDSSVLTLTIDDWRTSIQHSGYIDAVEYAASEVEVTE